jgi:hypothetical protein
MNVKELKAVLENLPDTMEIILQKDAEGNGYSPLSGGDANAVYVATTGYSGTVYDTEWTAEDCGMGEEMHTWLMGKERVLVLYPMN